MTVNVQYGGINSQHNQIATCNTNSTEAATAVFNREVGTPANTPGKNKLNKIFENLTNFISSAKNHIKDIGINRSLYSLNIKDSTVTNKNSSAMTMKVVNKKAAAIQAESNAVNNNPNEKNISNGVSAYRNHTEYKDLKGKEYKFLLFQEGLNRLVKGEKLLPNQNEIFKEAFNIAKPCMDIEFCTIIENKLAELNVEGEEKNIAEQKLATDSQSLTPIQSQSTHPNLPPPPPPLQLQTLDKQIPDVSQLLPPNK